MCWTNISFLPILKLFLFCFVFVIATIFGTCHKLEPLSPEKKSMWRRDMDCFLSICDFITNPSPIDQTIPEVKK